ncbi:MAG TPA: hypothetical protein VFS30_07885 [Dehalococcoidia bacterium]|nr:hypothetical protein [Dehalococcoidia bacterium]
MSSYLAVIYGTSPANNPVAWQLARSLPGKSAVLSLDQLLAGAIAQPSEDATAELDMAHTQLRLLVANYMRNGYNVVVEGVFYHERGGQTYRYEQDVDQLVSLMRNMTRKALTVHLRDPEAAAHFEYRTRYGVNALNFDSTTSVEEIAEALLQRLLAEEIT